MLGAPSIIMLAVNVAVPLVLLVAVLALMFRHMILVLPSLHSLGLAQFLTEKFYSHQHGNNCGGGQGGRANLLARQAKVIMGNVCQRERGERRRDHGHQKNHNAVDSFSHPANMRQRLA